MAIAGKRAAGLLALLVAAVVILGLVWWPEPRAASAIEAPALRPRDEVPATASEPLSREEAVAAMEPAREVAAAPQVESKPPAVDRTEGRLVAWLGIFVGPDRGVLLPEATVILTGASGGIRQAITSGEPHVLVRDLRPDRYTVRVEAEGHRHREQVLDLSDPEQATELSERTGGQPGFVERLVLWPHGWVAVLARTPDGRPFSALAEDLGIEPKRIFVGAFDVQTRLDPPGAGRAAEFPAPAVFHLPEGWQSWELPGACLGSLQLQIDPPMWVGLTVHGGETLWEPLAPGTDEIVFVLGPEHFEAQLARMRLCVLDSASGEGVAGALVTMRADTSAHRREEHQDVPTDSDGRVELARLVPGRYELTIRREQALHQERLELAPAELREHGDVRMGVGSAIELQAQSEDGTPRGVWIEIGPYRAGELADELYPPMLSCSTGEDGREKLPMPTGVSIVRATVYDQRQHHPTDVRSANFLLDPEHPPAGPVVLVVREPTEVTVELAGSEATRVHLIDDLDLVARSLTLESGASQRTQLVPGTYRARLLDALGTILSERPFDAGPEPVHLLLP